MLTLILAYVSATRHWTVLQLNYDTKIISNIPF